MCVLFAMNMAMPTFRLVKSSLGKSQENGKLFPVLCVVVDRLCVHKVLTTNSFS